MAVLRHPCLLGISASMHVEGKSDDVQDERYGLQRANQLKAKALQRLMIYPVHYP